MSEYQCCFCGKGIAHVSPDVGGLLYSTCADRAREFQLDQQVWCHTKCLTDRLHPSVKMYVLDVLEMREEAKDAP
jgi:hypothetical protein